MHSALYLVQEETLALKLCATLICLSVMTSCGIPKDPEGTLERVSGGTLRVGVAEAPPWVELTDEGPRGVEVSLVEDFAASIDATITWVPGSESELAEAIYMREIDLMIGGLAGTSSLSSEVTLTHPYFTSALVVGVPEGSDVPEDIAGMRVAAEIGSAAAGLLAKTDAEVVRVEDVTTFDGPIATEDFFLEDLGLTDTGVRLQETDHVMGVPHGENAFLVALERFLLARPDEVENLLGAEQP